MGEVKAGTVEAYCRACHYLLRGIGDKGKCPECGRAFDLDDVNTFTRHPRRRRAWQILRWSLACALMLLAVVAGGVGWLYWEWRQEQPAIAWVKQERGSVTTRQIGSERLRALAGRYGWLLERADAVFVGVRGGPRDGAAVVARLGQLRSVRLTGTGVDDGLLAQLRGRDEWVELVLPGARVTDEGLVRLGRLPKLRALFLARTRVTDRGLAVLANAPELEALHLGRTDVGGPGLAHLKDVPKLWWLDLSETGIGDDHLAVLRACGQLQRLDLSDTHVSSEGIRHLAGLGRLEKLYLPGTVVDDAAVTELAKLTTLRELNVRATKMTKGGLARLKQALPRAFIDSDF